MIEPDFYNTISQPAMAEYKDRGSKFIAFAYPVENAAECKQHLQHLKKGHPKAAHFCFAYRIGMDGNNFRQSDDGEPAGTAGKPILGQINSRNLINVLVVVIRYFGGTLLGVPGLINAYKTVTTLVLQVTPVINKPVEVIYLLHFDYTRMNEVMTVLKQYNCTIIGQEMQLFCSVTSGIPKARLADVLYQLKELQNVEVKKFEG